MAWPFEQPTTGWADRQAWRCELHDIVLQNTDLPSAGLRRDNTITGSGSDRCEVGMGKHISGLTLLEVLVVLAIIATISIGVPGFLLSMRQQGAGHAVNKLRADLQRARILAVKKKQECTIEFNNPGANQYATTLNQKINDLKAYKGGVCFMPRGPDGVTMATKVAFNRKGMSTTIVPSNIYIANQNRSRIYRVRILPPGGIFVHRWDGQSWKMK